MYLPNKKIFSSNVIIGASIALFIYFLKESSLLENITAFSIRLLLSIYQALANNRLSYAPSTINLISDALTILIAACAWTYFKSTRCKIIGNTVLALALIPVSLYVYTRYGVILTSVLIVCGILLNIAVDATVDHMSKVFRLRIVDEKQEAEFSVLGHLSHNVKPNIQIAKSPINAVIDFLEEKCLLGNALAKRLDGSDETVGEALQKAVMSLNQINDILDSTRKLVTRQIRKEEFRECEIRGIFEREIIPLYSQKLRIIVEGDCQLKARLHRESFVEAMNNLVRNAEIHAFPETHAEAVLKFGITESRKKIFIDYMNNGKPFPENLTAKDFLSFGRKSNDSPGEGLGGAWIGKVIEAHNGAFEIIRDEHPLHFRITLPKRGI